MCPDTRLVPSWRVGDRTFEEASALMQDLAPRLPNRVQLTTDGHSPYLQAVEDAFGNRVDFAQIVKQYSELGKNDQGDLSRDTDFILKRVIEGRPDFKHVSTSLVERQNLTIRMSMRRFTRRTNGFSKKLENHAHAVALHMMFYNFCRIHSSLRVTPAMEAGVTDSLMDIPDIVGLIDALTPAPGPRGSYIEARKAKAAQKVLAVRGARRRRRLRGWVGRSRLRRRISSPPTYVLERFGKGKFKPGQISNVVTPENGRSRVL